MKAPELRDRLLREPAEAHLVQHVDELLVALPENLGEVVRLPDRLLPQLGLECEFDCLAALGDRWQLEEISCDDDLIASQLTLYSGGRSATRT